MNFKVIKDIAKGFYEERNDHITKFRDNFVKIYIKRDEIDYKRLQGEAIRV